MGVKYTAGFNQVDTVKHTDTPIELTLSNSTYDDEPIDLLFGANPISIDFTSSDNDKLKALKGSQAVLDIIVNDNSFSLEELYTDNEMEWKGEISRGGNVIWKGFLLPDGMQEPFADPPYNVSCQLVDGLAILKNIPYAPSFGTFYEGKSSLLTIIARCLGKLQLGMNINTYAPLRYDGQTSNTDVFSQVMVWNERFLQDNKSETVEPMSCGEVLEAILKEWVCTIMQHNGEWLIVRIPDIDVNGMDFYRYDASGTFIDINTITPKKVLGTNGETGLDVMHIKSDQLKSNDFPYKEVRVRYEYGYLRELFDPATRQFLGTPSGVFNGWIKNGPIDADPRVFETDRFAVIHAFVGTNDFRRLSIDNPIEVEANTRFKLELDYYTTSNNAVLPLMIEVQTGGGTIYMQPDGSWDATFNGFRFDTASGGQIVTSTLEFTVPEGGWLTISIMAVRVSSGTISDWDIHVQEARLSVTQSETVNAEVAVSINNANYTTIPDVIDVHTGESKFDQYLGTMFKADGDTQTDGFYRDGSVTKVPFLRIASEDILYQYGRPMKKYEGSIYGYFEPFSIFEINNLPGLFFPVSLRYDIKNNTTRAVLIEIDNTAIPHTYRLEYEYQETQKVPVVGEGGSI